jgi:hypothetical protein
MKLYYVIFVIIALIFLYYSEFNTRSIGNFKVHNNYDPNDSVKVFAEIDRRIKILQNHMKKKYILFSSFSSFSQNEKGDEKGIEKGFEYTDIDMNERTKQFLQNYNSKNLYEISPSNLLGNTSFTEGKGKKVVFCLRDKSGALHEINTLMFVVLHEMTHIMNDRWGHEEYFWRLFRLVLIDAEEAGIYKPINYSIEPKNYCGMKITQNPYF